MTQAAQFWDKVAEKYAKQPIADEALSQKFFDLFILYTLG